MTDGKMSVNDEMAVIDMMDNTTANGFIEQVMATIADSLYRAGRSDDVKILADALVDAIGRAQYDAEIDRVYHFSQALCRNGARILSECHLEISSGGWHD